MAIQLSERDNLIFKLIEEHQVLLEKHIAWFISGDDKPVLIRDRLRKLFYLDYLLCERHGGKLPWWTTPTKPLVYMLSPLTRQLVSAGERDIDLSNCEIQRHLLEVANLRMLFLMDQREGRISNCAWTTIQKVKASDMTADAVVCFDRDGKSHRIGILNHPAMTSEDLIKAAENELSSGKIDCLWIVGRDEAHMLSMQQTFAATSIAGRIALSTHHELYKAGIVKANWQSAEKCSQEIGGQMVAALNWGIGGLASAQAFV